MVIPASYHPSVHISAVHPVLSVLGSAFFFFFPVSWLWGQPTSEPDVIHTFPLHSFIRADIGK